MSLSVGPKGFWGLCAGFSPRLLTDLLLVESLLLHCCCKHFHSWGSWSMQRLLSGWKGRASRHPDRKGNSDQVCQHFIPLCPGQQPSEVGCWNSAWLSGNDQLWQMLPYNCCSQKFRVFFFSLQSHHHHYDHEKQNFPLPLSGFLSTS